MKLILALVACFLIAFASCKKNDEAPSKSQRHTCNKPNDINVNMGQELESWFSSPVFVDYMQMNVKVYSNTGLSESVSITKSSNNMWFSKDVVCDTTFIYPTTTINYQSSIYNNQIKIVKGYVDDWGEYLSTVVIGTESKPKISDRSYPLNTPCLIIQAPNTLVRFAGMPEGNKNLNRPDTKYSYPYVEFSTYQDCYEYIGSYTVRGKVFNDVVLFKNPAKLQAPYSPYTKIFIDKKYGVIQFQKQDSTIWSFDFN